MKTNPYAASAAIASEQSDTDPQGPVAKLLISAPAITASFLAFLLTVAVLSSVFKFAFGPISIYGLFVAFGLGIFIAPVAIPKSHFAIDVSDGDGASGNVLNNAIVAQLLAAVDRN